MPFCWSRFYDDSHSVRRLCLLAFTPPSTLWWLSPHFVSPILVPWDDSSSPRAIISVDSGKKSLIRWEAMCVAGSDNNSAVNERRGTRTDTSLLRRLRTDVRLCRGAVEVEF